MPRSLTQVIPFGGFSGIRRDPPPLAYIAEPFLLRSAGNLV
jgi:hypothetical protein